MINFFRKHIRYVHVYLAVILLIFSLGTKFVGLELDPNRISAALVATLCAFIVVASIRIEDIVDRQKQLSYQLDLASDVLRNIVNVKAETDEAKLVLLESTRDFYHACNCARQISKTMLLMKIHNVGPDDKRSFVEDGQVTSELSSEAEEIRSAWYSGLREWNLKSGHHLERITVNSESSIENWVKLQDREMKGTSYICHLLPWDGEMPILNLCIFDDREVIFNFSTRRGEAPYQRSHVVGMRIIGKQAALFFHNRYYSRLIEYCRKAGVDKAVSSPDDQTTGPMSLAAR